MTEPRTKMAKPLLYAGGYSLDLYCDHRHEYGQQHCESFYSQTFGDCARQARKRGWVIHKDRTATCRRHRAGDGE